MIQISRISPSEARRFGLAEPLTTQNFFLFLSPRHKHAHFV
jgi:hypothetical protein